MFLSQLPLMAPNLRRDGGYMRDAIRRKTVWRLTIAIAAIMLLLSIASGVWASPSQRDLRQTVPTRTPTPEPPMATPVPPTATPVPPTPKPKKTSPPQQPTAVPTEAAVEPTEEVADAVEATVTPETEATSVAISTADYPESGADLQPLLGAAAALLALAGSSVYLIRRRQGDH